ncbi:hypothetical protein B6K89_16160 [Bacillus subtilis]|nr:hypothetical protein B6K89_16160 [Bacillus subtilis]
MSKGIALYLLFWIGFISSAVYLYCTNLGIRDTVNGVFNWLTGPILAGGIVYVIFGLPLTIRILRRKLKEEKEFQKQVAQRR